MFSLLSSENHLHKVWYNKRVNQNELFSLLGAKDTEDVLRHFPSRYESLVPTLIPSSPKPGEKIIVKGTISHLRNINARGSSLIRFKVHTLAGHQVDFLLYQQPFYIGRLSSGKQLRVVGTYSEARKVYRASNIFDLDNYYVLTGIRPIYSLPRKVSTSYFTSFLKKTLSYPRGKIRKSKVPSYLVDKYRLIPEYDAYRFVHLPKTDKELKAGLRVFKYEEALEYSVKSLRRKRKADQIKKKDRLPIPHEKINQFVSSLSYKLTHDQISAIHDIVLDREKDKIRYRLLQGDVGTGKTIVAFTAMYANFLRKKQGVLMAPTFELSKQHYDKARQILAPFGRKIAFLAGGTPAKEKRLILSGLAKGEIDLLISTNSVLSDNVTFDSLGLSIIDEQQLFGVKQREELLSKDESNDRLRRSATPIPRTLSQIINADLDVSTLDQFPHGQRNVKTILVSSHDPIVFSSIEKAVNAKRQVYIVCPKIDQGEKETSSAESVYKERCERFGEENVQLLHGRIKKESQNQIISAFASGDKPILVSTTVIEVGIDVTSACLLIAYDANYFGLSSLHQLRGRIGRDGKFGLCILIYDGENQEAKDKLEFLTTCSDGLKISEFDLKQRGRGSYSGSGQSGKSELMVCNFVQDQIRFSCAKEDAKRILSHPERKENKEYLDSLDRSKDFLIV